MDALRRALFQARPDWSALIRYTECGLTPSEIGRLLGCTPDAARHRQVRLERLGLLTRHLHPQQAAAGRLGAAAKQVADRRQADLFGERMP